MVRKLSKSSVTSSDAIDQALKEVSEIEAPKPEQIVEPLKESSKSKAKPSVKVDKKLFAMVPHNQRVPQELFDRIDNAFREERIKRRSSGEKFTKNSLGIEAFELWLKHRGY